MWGYVGSMTTHITNTATPMTTASQLSSNRISVTNGHMAQINPAPSTVRLT